MIILRSCHRQLRLLGARSSAFKCQWALMSQDTGSTSSSSSSSSEAKASLPTVTDDSDVIEEEYIISKFYKPQVVPEVPITSLNILDRATKIKKTGSFCADLFTGLYDHDYLIYPEPLQDRIENQKLKEQAYMVKQMFPKVWNDEALLQKYNFFNLFQLSVTEMMTVFESIGSSMDKCYDFSDKPFDETHVNLTRSILSLINRNCLTYWPIYKSTNEIAKSLLPQKHIRFGGSSEMHTDIHKPIGFCWTEQVKSLGILPPQEWLTDGKLGDKDVGHMILKGNKTNILYDERMEYFLMFYRDQNLAKEHDIEDLKFDPNPASDPFAGACLVHKDELVFSPEYRDSAGITYVDCNIDNLINSERLIFPAERKDTKAVNIKGLGQLATCSVVLGMLKGSLAKTYKNLIDYKTKLLTCDLIESKLSKITADIFAIESMLYYIAGMYDGLEDGFDAHMETTILKSVTYELTQKCLMELQQINGTDLTNFSHVIDQVNTFDCFLGGNLYNRQYISTLGVIWYARSNNVPLNKMRLTPWYWRNYMRHMFVQMAERNDWLTINADIRGQLHPSLNDAATNLEFIVKRIGFATEDLCQRHGEDITGRQSVLIHLSELIISTFMLTTMCARASKSYCNGSRNGHIDVMITCEYSHELSLQASHHLSRLGSIYHLVEDRIKEVAQENIKAGGYYAESPLDPNI